MYYLKHLVNYLINPIGIGMLLMGLGLVVLIWHERMKWGWFVRQGRRLGVGLLVGALGWLWLWSTGLWMRVVATPLEDAWPVVAAEQAPVADAIVILGGCMGANTNAYMYAEMFAAADRVWHAARLYKAGKAPLVVPSGRGDRETTLRLLRDLGVPESAIAGEFDSRNTEENAKFVGQLLKARVKDAGRRPKVLLVTSALHMTRAKMMFEKYAPEVECVPAATDYEVTVLCKRGLEFRDWLPSADALSRNTYAFKEWLGQLAYRVVGR